MAKKVLITGISGFVGSHLADYLVGLGDYAIAGTYLSEKSLANLTQVQGKVDLHQVDLTDKDATQKLVETVRPDLLFHLASLTAVGESYRIPATVITNNVAAELNILEAIRLTNLDSCRILAVSSADVYGKVKKEDIPIDEETPLMPTNAYAVSKIASDFLALQYAIAYNLPIIRARPFNHIGPRQNTGFVVADFAKKIAEMEKGILAPLLRVGDLDNKRDFTDVRDIVRAYIILIEKGIPGEVYNIGTGTSYKIGDILGMLVSFSKIEIKVEKDTNLLRPEDAQDRVCDNSKFTKLSGWKPEIELSQTLKDTLEYWRGIV